MARVLQRLVPSKGLRVIFRSLSKTSRDSSTQNAKTKLGFFDKLWDMGDLAPYIDAHSKTLTANPACYELVFERVKPQFMEEYVQSTGEINTKLSATEEYPGQLIGSWNTVYGEGDEAIHLWVYEDGYTGASKQLEYARENKELKEHIKEKAHWLRSRRNQLLHEFSYWGKPTPRKQSHIYELRSYDLKPGTLIEWGNKWGAAIDIRRKDAVGGFFSQLGALYQVHHIWAYNDLQHRKTERERMWEDPGWDDCVAATVPLIRQMQCRVLQPTKNSPMQ